MTKGLEKLSLGERGFLSKYATTTLNAAEDCEYCGNGCGTSNCASCCSSMDSYLTKKIAT